MNIVCVCVVIQAFHLFGIHFQYMWLFLFVHIDSKSMTSHTKNTLISHDTETNDRWLE